MKPEDNTAVLTDENSEENDPQRDGFPRFKVAHLEPGLDDENDALIATLSGPENDEDAAINEPEVAAVKSELDAVLALYPGMAKHITPNTKSVSIDELVSATKHSRVKIVNRIEKGILKPTRRNKELVLLPSVLDWLKTEPLPKGNTDKMHVVKPNIQYVS